MHLQSRTRHRVSVAAICIAASACYEGIEPPPADSTPVEVAVEDEPFHLVTVTEDGFEAKLVLDGESIAVVSRTEGAKTRVTVTGGEAYAELSVDFAAAEGTGSIGGRAIEEIVEQDDPLVDAGRVRDVLDAVVLGASELVSAAVSEGTEPPAPGVDPTLDGLRLLTSLSTFTSPQGPDDLETPPEGALAPEDGFTAENDPAADWWCTPHWTCWPSVAWGCAKVKSGGWWSKAKCAVAVLESCGFLCPSGTYAEFWAGNCLYAASIYANHTSTIYCVGGGCSTCY